MDDSSSEDERIERMLRNELQLDDSDEGIESCVSYFDTEDIICDRVYPLPSRPPLQMLYSSDEEDEEEAANGGRRLYDRYPHHVKSVSRGDDDSNNRGAQLRNLLMNTRTNGEGLSIGLYDTPTRIIGMAIRGGKIMYFVMLEYTEDESYPIDECIMRRNYPDLVIEFHEDLILNPTNYEEF